MSSVTRYLDPALLERLRTYQLSARSVVDGTTLGQHRSPVRGASVDSAQREFEVQGDSVVVALVDEQLTDIKLQLEILDSEGSRLVCEQERRDYARARAPAPPSFRRGREAVEVRSGARGIQGVVGGHQRELSC